MNIEELSKPLDRARVKGRKQGFNEVSYIEGWWAISEANRIFGFDGWFRETVYCKEVCRSDVKVGKQQKDGYKVGYEAHVKIIVNNKDGGVVIREGTGHGSGISTDIFDCIEGAAKEAETDAMKRALMTFGNPFGLALYDKTQANVADQYQIDLQNAIEAHSKTIEAVQAGIASNDLTLAAEAWWELTKEEMGSIWVAPTKCKEMGIEPVFTTQEREIIKSTAFREAHFGESNE